MRPRYLFQTVKITSPAAAAIPALAEIDIKGVAESVSHERPGQMFVIVTNKHSQALSVTDIHVDSSRFLTPKGPGVKELQDPLVSKVGLGEVKVFPFTMTPADQIVPGKYPVVVVVSYRSPDGSSGAVAKAQDIELTVLGESDLLSKLGVPSLLFLPGVLFLLSWQLLWSYGKDKTARDAYSMTPTAGAFWVIAVLISLISAFAYPWIMRLFGQKRDYLGAYGLQDYIYVFTGAIVAASVFFGLVALCRAGIVFFFSPNENDRPIDILRKLGYLRETITCHLAGPANNAAQQVYVLEPWGQGAFLWVIPRAQLAVQDHAPAAALDLVQQIANGEITGARTLARRLKQGIDKGWWTFGWGALGTITGPRRVAVANWPVLEQRAPYIEVS